MAADLDELLARADRALEESPRREPTREELMRDLEVAIEHLGNMPPGTPRHNLAVRWVAGLRAKLEQSERVEPPALELVRGGRDDAI